jgi:hypothetical protein
MKTLSPLALSYHDPDENCAKNVYCSTYLDIHLLKGGTHARHPPAVLADECLVRWHAFAVVLLPRYEWAFT